jgi:hypothetical protein
LRIIETVGINRQIQYYLNNFETKEEKEKKKEKKRAKKERRPGTTLWHLVKSCHSLSYAIRNIVKLIFVQYF